MTEVTPSMNKVPVASIIFNTSQTPNPTPGFCECAAGDERGYVGCGHVPFTCHDVCVSVPGASFSPDFVLVKRLEKAF